MRIIPLNKPCFPIGLRTQGKSANFFFINTYKLLFILNVKMKALLNQVSPNKSKIN